MALVFFVMLAALQVIAAGGLSKMFLLPTAQAQSRELRAFGDAFATDASDKHHNSSVRKKAPDAGDLPSGLSPYTKKNNATEADLGVLALAALAPYVHRGDEALAAAELALLSLAGDVSKTDGKLGLFVGGLFLGALLFGGIPLLLHACARSIKKAIEAGVERSEAAIGVHARIGRISVHLFEGYVAVHGVTVLNPKGYDSEYLLRVKKVHIDLHTFTLVTSSFKQILVDKMVFKGVDVWYNKAARSSNINDVLNLDPGDTASDRALFGGKPAASGVKAAAAASSDAGPSRGGAPVTLKEVRIEDLGMRMEHMMFQGSGLRTEMADICYADFASEVTTGECCAHTVALKLLQGVLRSITKTAGSAQRSKRPGT